MENKLLFGILGFLLIIGMLGFVCAEPTIDPEIYEAFEEYDWVNIDVEYIAENISEPLTIENVVERQKYVINLTVGDFSYIPETELEIIGTGIEPGKFFAVITKEGFDELISDPRIMRVNLPLGEPGYAIINKSMEGINSVEEKESNWLGILIGIIVVIFIIILYILIRRKKK